MTVRRVALVAALVAAVAMPAGCGGDEAEVPEPAGARVVVTSPAFREGGAIPDRYTCRGAGDWPELSWSGLPADATGVAVVVSDPDAPDGTFVHRIVTGLPPRDGTLGARPPAGAREADNSRGDPGWTPPCPPSGTHHYRFTVIALDKETGLAQGASLDDALAAVDEHATARGTLTATYSRN